jgi:hypothetical protein
MMLMAMAGSAFAAGEARMHKSNNCGAKYGKRDGQKPTPSYFTENLPSGIAF